MTDQLVDVETELLWGRGESELVFRWAADAPVSLAAVTVDGRHHELHAVPAIEVLTVGNGHRPASDRLAHTSLGERFRYAGHTDVRAGATSILTISQEAAGLAADWILERRDGSDVIRSTVRVTNTGSSPVVLRSVASWSAGFTPATEDPDALLSWDRVVGVGDWLGEGRWTREPLRSWFPRLEEHLTGHNPRSAGITTSDGTWSTGKSQPIGFLESKPLGIAWLWQVEHNGAWRTEVGEDTDGGYLALSGPTEIDSSWNRELAPGDSFTTVPVAVAVGPDFDTVTAQLTEYRRLTRRSHPDNEAMGVVFNDYMNTLNGDPTTEKLLPLITAAAEAGAEIFCIDAGWYDDSGQWWDSVGEWRPSTTRFPGGMGEVIDAIRANGMTPGLWLEPEVVGVQSPLVGSLPDEAFLLRRGQRVAEHDRYHLDLRHPAAIAHLDATVDRLVAEFGIGFFKFDYNINPGAGTDHASHSLGDGLLEHNRAHLAWIDALLERHPTLIIENCSSGAMRSDWAMLSRLHMQSTSDQQDFLRFPPIAASAPLTMLPEQAANWAYPQPAMDAETVAFCLVTGLLGRFYLSGYLNRMTPESRAMVAEAVSVAKSVRSDIRGSVPTWPLGLPGWDDPWIALSLHQDGSELLSVWRRNAAESAIQLALPHLTGRDLRVETVFPVRLAPWDTSWDAATGTLTVHAGDAPVAARTFRLVPVSS